MKKKIDMIRRQRGQSLVEMALGLILILWLLSGAVDFGIGFFSYVAIRDAAQEGAIFGSIRPPLDTPSDEQIIFRVTQSSNEPVNLADPDTVHVTICHKHNPGDPNELCDNTPDPTLCSGDQLIVSVQYDFPVMMALTTIFTGPIIHIRSSATSSILLPACP